jgi:gamma-glutamyltranspeptidase/glutathione hydrolase
VHYQIEAMRHAYVDRNSYLGDPDFVKNPLERLLDKNYAASLRAVIDPNKAGNAVSLTYTLNGWFGAPNLFGLVQGEANSIAPGKRPLSSMSPTIVTKDGKPVMVVGTPGGSRIITAVLHSIINVIDYGMNVQEAVDAPKFHQQWLPDLTNLETFSVSPDTRKLLEAMGHKLGGPQPANHLAAILIGAPTLGGKPVGKNRFYGANDPRRNSGLALGY